MAVLVVDTFTAADSTAINGRTPDTTVSGRTWAAGNWFAGSVGAIDIQGNQARMNASNAGFSIDLGTADFFAHAWIPMPSSFATAYRGGFRFRSAKQANAIAGASDENYYFLVVRFDLGSGQIRLIKTVNGVETDIGTNVTFAFSTSTTYKISLKAQGSTYTIYVDDVQKKQETDATYTTQTIMGISAGTLAGDFFVDSVEFDSLGGVSIPVLVNHYKQQGVMA